MEDGRGGRRRQRMRGLSSAAEDVSASLSSKARADDCVLAALTLLSFQSDPANSHIGADTCSIATTPPFQNGAGHGQPAGHFEPKPP
jgi:hypothetical protein